MLTRSRAAVLVLAGLTLAACGNVHPGAAAVVDGQTISMKSVDQARRGSTARTALQRQQAAPSLATPTSGARTVSTLVSLVVARKLAKEEDITPKPSDYQLTTDRRAQVAKSFPDEVDPDEFDKLIEDSQELSADLHRPRREDHGPGADGGDAEPDRRGRPSRDHQGVQGQRRRVRASIRAQQHRCRLGRHDRFAVRRRRPTSARRAGPAARSATLLLMRIVVLSPRVAPGILTLAGVGCAARSVGRTRLR